MPASNTTQTSRSAVIREVDVVIEAYLVTLESMRTAVKAYDTGDTETSSSKREQAYECLSTLLDGVDFRSVDLTDSFRQVHLHALRLIWSKEPQQWLTAINVLQRLHDSCHESRAKSKTQGNPSSAAIL